jgi:hypothetical protein
MIEKIVISRVNKIGIKENRLHAAQTRQKGSTRLWQGIVSSDKSETRSRRVPFQQRS